MHAKSTTSIPLHSFRTVPIRSLTAVALDRDFLFEPVEIYYTSLFLHVVNANAKGLLVKNDTNTTIKIPRNARLGHL